MDSQLILLKDPLLLAFVLALGLVIGSFLNVVIFRLPRGQSLWRPGSACPHCNHGIRWWENIPVLSFLILRAKCSACSISIPIRYPVVESLTGLLFLAAFLLKGPSLALAVRDFPFLALLVAITFIDLDHRIIPDRLNLLGGVLGLATAGLDSQLGWTGAWIGALGGFSVFYGFAWIYWKATGRSGLGGGDIKFLAMLGAFLGFQGVFVVIFLSSILGSVVGLAMGVIQKRTGQTESILKTALPYGPFLVIGALVAYFFQQTLTEFIWLPFMNPI